MLCYTTYIIINIKNFDESKKKKRKRKIQLSLNTIIPSSQS